MIDPQEIPHPVPQWQMIKATAKAWSHDYAQSTAAAFSNYTLLPLAPLQIIVIAVAGMVFGKEAAQAAIVAQLGGMMGEESAAAVEVPPKAALEPARGVDATIVGIIGLLLGAAALFWQLQCALYRIWRVPARKDESGVWQLFRMRLLSFQLALGVG